MAVAVLNLQRRVKVPKELIRRLAQSALAALGRAGAEVHLAFVNDALARRLNSQYRGASQPTDILAFSLETPGLGRLLGEVVVSAEAARRQARRLRVPVALELQLLVVHGLLHLVGYDDRDPREARLMHERERGILRQAFGPVPQRLWTGLLTTP